MIRLKCTGKWEAGRRRESINFKSCCSIVSSPLLEIKISFQEVLSRCRECPKFANRALPKSFHDVIILKLYFNQASFRTIWFATLLQWIWFFLVLWIFERSPDRLFLLKASEISKFSINMTIIVASQHFSTRCNILNEFGWAQSH